MQAKTTVHLANNGNDMHTVRWYMWVVGYDDYFSMDEQHSRWQRAPVFGGQSCWHKMFKLRDSPVGKNVFLGRVFLLFCYIWFYVHVAVMSTICEICNRIGRFGQMQKFFCCCTHLFGETVLSSRNVQLGDSPVGKKILGTVFVLLLYTILF